MYGSVEHMVKQPIHLEERMVAADRLEKVMGELNLGLKPPIYVDTMDNTASLSFGALPERLVIILDGRIEFIGGKGPEEYSLDEALVVLRTLLE
eukprot:m.37389 g.37389  ORF g.37389 m.37389 type:complete len:94 (-) comp17649_c0_seq3:59-340(-)